ncbi:MAG: hypothetical protein LPK45_00290 [Bacteroidota bacterium]|nr:hypothetical protein [Bacteroidota bacterium]MDX5429458.1 hypothetical protein [Bacteroidota bacterium]MDX5468250.1 hypothetical protein [Bacteroidota bacterium]
MYNNRQLLLGAFIGLLVPAFILLLMYAYKFAESSVESFIDASVKHGVAAPMIVLSLLGNLGLFFLFLQRDKLWAARGVMIATLLYGLVMLYFKFQV